MSERGITKEEFITAAKIESLARQNAQQSIRIAELESQLNVTQIELNLLKNEQEKLPGEQTTQEAGVEAEEVANDPTH